MIQNNLYTSDNLGIYTSCVYDAQGVKLHEKKFDDFFNAEMWCKAMALAVNGKFELLDTDTKTLLATGAGEKSYSDLEHGTEVELEHYDTIAKVLTKSGVNPTDEKIREVAKAIAEDHIAEDQDYYLKLSTFENGMDTISMIKKLEKEQTGKEWSDELLKKMSEVERGRLLQSLMDMGETRKRFRNIQSVGKSNEYSWGIDGQGIT